MCCCWYPYYLSTRIIKFYSYNYYTLGKQQQQQQQLGRIEALYVFVSGGGDTHSALYT